MHARTRHIIIGLFSIAIVGSLIAYAATGAYPYSHSRDPEIEQANTQSGLSDLFGNADPADAPPPQAVKSVNAIGLFPSGPSGIESISVASISGPSLAVIVFMLWLGHREKKRAVAANPTAAPEPHLNS